MSQPVTSCSAVTGQPCFRVQAVFIDLDGTLLDTIGDLTVAANAMLNDFGRPGISEETVAGYVGRGIQRLVERCFDDAAPADALEVFRSHYALSNGTAARVYPGVIEGLQAMRAKGLRLACITNKAAAFTLPLLAARNLAAYFEIVVSGDSLPRAKPDPLPLLHVCQHFGIAPSAALMLGDSLNDVLAARAAGCPVVCVPYGYHGGQPVKAADCDAIVPSLAAAAQLIASLSAQ